MVSVLFASSLRREYKESWWTLKLLSLVVVSACCIVSVVFGVVSLSHGVKPIVSQGLSMNHLVGLSSILQQDDNSTNFDSDSYFSLINASTNCEFSSVPFNLSCQYMFWNNSGCDSDNKYLYLLECTPLHDYQPLYYIISIIFIIIYFYLLGDTAESYFSPSLFKISRYLSLSPNLAGITLLALGNGSPDLSSIVS